MSPWLRLAALFVVAITAALLLKVLPPIVVLVGFVGGVAWLNHVLKGRVKAEARRDQASVIGLRREVEDPFGLVGYPFALFGRGADPVVDGLVWGTWRGLEVRRFDVSFAPPVAGPRSERPRFACALAPIPAEVPHLLIEPVTFVTRLASEAPMPALRSGTPRIDEAFLVRCEDPSFVGRFLDAEMVGWLVGQGEDRGYEVVGSLALVYGPASTAGDLVSTLETLQAFIEHVPASLPGPGVGSEPWRVGPDRGLGP